jgi:hypothetical protein
VSEVIDLRPTLGIVRDQGPRGTCLAFAVTVAHEQARRRRRGALEAELGEELLHWACKEIDGDRSPGTHLRSAERVLIDTGQSAARLWPYDSTRSDSDGTYTPPSGALEDDEMRRGTLAATSVDLENLRDLLRAGHVVVVGLELWAQFYAPHAGRLDSPSPSDLLGDAHAVAVVGFDEDKYELLLRNSWGEGWGERGHGHLPYTALPVACRGAWILEDDIDG